MYECNQRKCVTLSFSAGETSVWDLISGTVLSVFTPDSKIQCLSMVDDENCSFLLELSDNAGLIRMTLGKKRGAKIATTTQQGHLFGEPNSSEEDDIETKRVG